MDGEKERWAGAFIPSIGKVRMDFLLNSILNKHSC